MASRADPLTTAGSSLVLLATATLACYLPHAMRPQSILLGR